MVESEEGLGCCTERGPLQLLTVKTWGKGVNVVDQVVRDTGRGDLRWIPECLGDDEWGLQ